MATHGLMDVQIYFPRKTQTDLQNVLNQAKNGQGYLRNAVINLLNDAGDGAGLVVSAGSIADVAASSSFTVTAANSTVGDRLILTGPDGVVTLTCVAASTENPLIGQYSVGGGTDANLATSIRTAFNAYPAAKKYVTAGGSTNTVALTAVPNGSYGNGIKLVKQVTTSGVFSFTSGTAFTGGVSVNDSKSITVTIGTNPVANDTLRFGNVTLTWVASATNENQVTIGGTTTVSATNLAAKLAAHSILGGMMSYSSATNVVTLSSARPDLVLYLLYIVSSTGSVTVSGQLQSGCTFTNSATTPSATAGIW